MFARSSFRAFTRPRAPLPFGCQISSSTWRFFSSSALRAKGSAKSTVTTPKSSPKTSPPEDTLKFAGRRPEGFGNLARKVAKEGEVVLFKAPSQRAYVLGAYGIAAFCFAYSVYNSNIIFRDPIVPIPMWQQTLFGGVCVTMSIMGTVFLFKTGRLINSVKAVNANGVTTLRFNVRSMIPLKKPYEVDALPRQIAFSRRLVVHPDRLNAGATTGQHAQVSIFKQPVKRMSIFLFKIFRSIRQVFTQEDYILLEIEGQKGVFRMDSGGFVSEDFLVIGNPVSTY